MARKIALPQNVWGASHAAPSRRAALSLLHTLVEEERKFEGGVSYEPGSFPGSFAGGNGLSHHTLQSTNALQQREIMLFIGKLMGTSILISTATHWITLQAYCNTLQHTAPHYNTLQQTQKRLALHSTHCNTLQHTATHCNTLQHTASHCITLQHNSAHCNTLQRTTTNCNTLKKDLSCSACIATHCTTVTAPHCNTLQHTPTFCNTLQRNLSCTAHTAQHCITLHHTASHCITLQRTATNTAKLFVLKCSVLYLQTKLQCSVL